jgi:hypothetical protein
MSKDLLPDIGTVSTAEVDGLKIRFVKAGTTAGIPIILTAPWPGKYLLLSSPCSASFRKISFDIGRFARFRSLAKPS